MPNFIKELNFKYKIMRKNSKSSRKSLSPTKKTKSKMK